MRCTRIHLAQQQHEIENISDDLWFAINLNKLILFVLSADCAVHRSLDTNLNARDLYPRWEKTMKQKWKKRKSNKRTHIALLCFIFDWSCA